MRTLLTLLCVGFAAPLAAADDTPESRAKAALALTAAKNAVVCGKCLTDGEAAYALAKRTGRPLVYAVNCDCHGFAKANVAVVVCRIKTYDADKQADKPRFVLITAGDDGGMYVRDSLPAATKPAELKTAVEKAAKPKPTKPQPPAKEPLSWSYAPYCPPFAST